MPLPRAPLERKRNRMQGIVPAGPTKRHQRREYSQLGPALNLARRRESIS